MIAEEIEFQISQYVDGTLSVAQKRAVDTVLQADSAARKILVDYQRLNGQLVKSNAGPSVHWNRLSDHLSKQIDRAATPIIAGRIEKASSFAWRLRIAAAVLVAGTAWMVVRHRTHGSTAPVVPVSTSDVSGPQPEVATGNPVEDVQVGPSQLAKRNDGTRYGEGVIVPGPSKVVISGLTPSVKHDSHLH